MEATRFGLRQFREFSTTHGCFSRFLFQFDGIVAALHFCRYFFVSKTAHCPFSIRGHWRAAAQ
jgi:hypothetical protein